MPRVVGGRGHGEKPGIVVDIESVIDRSHARRVVVNRIPFDVVPLKLHGCGLAGDDRCRNSNIAQERTAIGGICACGRGEGPGRTSPRRVRHGNRDRSGTRVGKRPQSNHSVFGVIENLGTVDRDLVHRSCVGDLRSRDPLANRIPFHQLTENRVVEIKMPLRAFGDEELRIVRIVRGLGVGKDARSVVLQIEVELIIEICQRRATAAGSGRIPCLQNEVVDHPVKNNLVGTGLVVETAIYQFLDARHRTRGFVCEESENHFAVTIDVQAKRFLVGDHLGRDHRRVAALHGDRQGPTVGIIRVDRNVQRRSVENGLVRDLDDRRIASGWNRHTRESRKLRQCLDPRNAGPVGKFPSGILRHVFADRRRVARAIRVGHFDERKIVLAVLEQILLLGAKGAPIRTKESHPCLLQSLRELDQIGSVFPFAHQGRAIHHATVVVGRVAECGGIETVRVSCSAGEEVRRHQLACLQRFKVNGPGCPRRAVIEYSLQEGAKPVSCFGKRMIL